MTSADYFSLSATWYSQRRGFELPLEILHVLTKADPAERSIEECLHMDA